MNSELKILITLLLTATFASAQSISTHLPEKINPKDQYLFYLHGAVVSVKGDNAINDGAPEWGPYEYSNILDSLSKRGFHVISEIRKQDVDDSVYVLKIAFQVDSLLKAGVKPSSILLLGASAGWSYVLEAADRLQNPSLRCVMMGGCWPDTWKEYGSLRLKGYFLSVIENSDPHGTCTDIFKGRKSISGFKEVRLNTGLSHGFFYKGRKVWMDPVLEWFNDLKKQP